ncbi:hypothetical protein EHW99_3700 (plasmid) [Erwinia amylovora]|uniref:Uncharacterized protein n=2 Tax=Erwinia amylovora TaxID=552 RepID=A0A831A8U4_ERWAM|nr:hypothetical protein EaACW_pEA290022 [Erwinia amylovora ACW56400]QJQ56399.1 hypothetical protein EHX00_3700 [Erwinia amylovora]CBA18934.1 hypothetical protein predicted by Glimmer/Critica [Erwinia amylovora CFBP1430]CCO80613.1 hypothetical protein BN432_pEA290022 [Erwinia amylovora Ea356]CCO84429.1 hypothetical protein BN433_pEA290022 [Erwinia amylovora Ea266]CCO88179.1 hypothetical protein BN434_pEA290022 [Erwinia amylovora CFBP 2585]CCO91972.1 hypothetical protein BN435_pEA290022 [Erwini
MQATDPWQKPETPLMQHLAFILVRFDAGTQHGMNACLVTTGMR